MGKRSDIPRASADTNPLLSVNQIKVMYRGRYTFDQAALYLGIGEDKLRALVNEGKLGVLIDPTLGDSLTISRAECDRYMNSITRYKAQGTAPLSGPQRA